jgi:hypothetical protein
VEASIFSRAHFLCAVVFFLWTFLSVAMKKFLRICSLFQRGILRFG